MQKTEKQCPPGDGQHLKRLQRLSRRAGELRRCSFEKGMNFLKHIVGLCWHSGFRTGAGCEALKKQWRSGVSHPDDLGGGPIKLNGVKIRGINGHLPQLHYSDPSVLAAVGKQLLQFAKLRRRCRSEEHTSE